MEVTKAIVVRENELLTAIHKHTEQKMLVKQANKMVDVLRKANITDEKVREQHVTDIQRRTEQVENGICPSCNSPLVERMGQYGAFLGCSGYPCCKFKVSMKKEKGLVRS
ncbi:topoisomerase-like DNA binding C4 zinc finger protein [Aneurinibacillus soli]|uniref:DNA topoisomerase I n=1 Tax=Aneurinibacillus soli TaxID=1500254 RepID=A0A0U5BAX2_9BACL|nr:topoisomerase DNA-binding C4 zinc finger domain-containing protein [Aneurinibacillus soli]PYE57391.1 topoisomerase-like DNA binding C4 zinc finger protein [Aneurinibacillus soli]BAU28790.1 DNA topoisomerase I [Aneurinibacillus soli]